MLDITKKWIDNTPIAYRKKFGQYFTPSQIRNKLFEFLPKMDNAIVLEPAIGTGEFVNDIYKNLNNCTINGFDIDPEITKEIPESVSITNVSFLDLNPEPIYDYIITNPPYYQFTLNDDIRTKFNIVIDGRVNIYSLFIKQSIDFLKIGGYLAFVVPTSMNSGRYFEKLRSYIINTCEVEHIEFFNSGNFIDAQQNVQIIILKKGINTGKNIFSKNGLIIFTPESEKLNSYYEGTKSIKELGYMVKTGSIDWCKNRDKLLNDSNYTTLIWSHNIKLGFLSLNTNDKKPQYIDQQGINGPAIVVNRITGAVGKGAIKASIVTGRFLAENHVNVITSTDPKCELSVILRSLCDPKTIELLQMITGNTQLSKTELENLIPIKVH